MTNLAEVGDRGQRYEHRCDDEEGNEFVIGWSDHPTGALARMVALHPSYENHKVVDRKPL